MEVIKAAPSAPNWLFWGLVLVFLIPFIFVALQLLLVPSRPRAIARAKKVAVEVAGSKWYVKEITILYGRRLEHLDSQGWEKRTSRGSGLYNGVACLLLFSTDSPRQKVEFYIRRGHPSARTLKQLSYLEVVEFEYVDPPLPDGPDTEIGSYLRLKVWQ